MTIMGKWVGTDVSTLVIPKRLGSTFWLGVLLFRGYIEAFTVKVAWAHG